MKPLSGNYCRALLALACASLFTSSVSAQDGNWDKTFYSAGVMRVYQQDLTDLLADEYNPGEVTTTNIYSNSVAISEALDADVEEVPAEILENTISFLPELKANRFKNDRMARVFSGYENDGVIYQGGEYSEVNDPDGWQRLMDFNLTVGDSFESRGLSGKSVNEPGGNHAIAPEDNKLYVTADEIIEVRGRKFRRLTISDSRNTVRDYWVQGVGACNSVFMEYNDVMATDGRLYGAPRLMAYYYHGEMIFSHDDFATENVKSAVRLLPEESGGASAKFVHDLNGVRHSSVPSSGVYIRDGRKHVAR